MELIPYPPLLAASVMLAITLTGLSGAQAADYLVPTSGVPGQIHLDKLTVTDTLGNHFTDRLKIQANDTQALHVGQKYSLIEVVPTSPGTEDGAFTIIDKTLVIPQLFQNQLPGYNVTLLLTNTDPAELTVTGLGVVGTQGPKGDIGAKGNNGSDGAQGVKGDTGATGAIGPQGPIGLTGAAGTNGSNGTNGSDGLTTSVNGVTQVGGAITLTKSNISLGNVDNTSDVNKPVSTATQSALTLKADLASPALTGIPTAPTAGAGDNTTQLATTAFVTNAVIPATHAIGEVFGGGIVFYVYDGGRHGLIAATADQSAGIRWHGGTNTNTRARADGVGAGKANNALIIANQSAVDGNAFAATVCNEYSVTVDGVTYGDWYLPSKSELNLLFLQKAVVGIASGFYWSSTEDDADLAWLQAFSDGFQASFNKNVIRLVRAVRAF